MNIYDDSSPAIQRWVDALLDGVPEGRCGCGHCELTFATREEVDVHAKDAHGVTLPAHSQEGGK